LALRLPTRRNRVEVCEPILLVGRERRSYTDGPEVELFEFGPAQAAAEEVQRLALVVGWLRLWDAERLIVRTSGIDPRKTVSLVSAEALAMERVNLTVQFVAECRNRCYINTTEIERRQAALSARVVKRKPLTALASFMAVRPCERRHRSGCLAGVGHGVSRHPVVYIALEIANGAATIFQKARSAANAAELFKVCRCQAGVCRRLRGIEGGVATLRQFSPAAL
jgi:hypothetical protein